MRMPSTTEPVRDLEDLHRLEQYFRARGEWRNRAMLILGCCTALRITDLLGLTWGRVYDFSRMKFKDTFPIQERKTGKRKVVALNRQAVDALMDWYNHSDIEPEEDGYIFANSGRKGYGVKGMPITRQQAWRVITRAATACGVPGAISCHSLRKTFGYHAIKDNGVNPAILMKIYNHTSYEVTERYLGITEDQANEVYMGMDLFGEGPGGNRK